MAADDPTHEADELRLLADDCAREARLFLETARGLATGQAPDAALPLALLALSQVLTMGARLGAMQDVVPTLRFEPDPGAEPSTEALRRGIANLFAGLDDYVDLVDPVSSRELTEGSVSDDIAHVAAALAHGLVHHDAGRPTEALWWWQFSYLSDWGERAASGLRVVLGLLSHVRLDADDETVADAEFDALHP